MQYLKKVKPIMDLADDAGLSYEAYKTRIYRYRGVVKKLSMDVMSNRHANRLAA